MTTKQTRYCDSCTNAARDEAGFELDPFSIHTVLFDMGADIADHICDSPENGEPCDCDCRRHR